MCNTTERAYNIQQSDLITGNLSKPQPADNRTETFMVKLPDWAADHLVSIQVLVSIFACERRQCYSEAHSGTIHYDWIAVEMDFGRKICSTAQEHDRKQANSTTRSRR